MCERTAEGKMIGHAVNEGSVSGYLAAPEGKKGPGLLVIQEWWGLVPHIKDVADRFARAGFVAFAPNMYHGDPATSPDEAKRLMMALNVEAAGKALRAGAEFLLAQDAVSPKKVGALGFCMGGKLALFVGCEHPDVISAVVDFYGIHPKISLDLSKLRAPALAHFGTHDTSVKEADARELVTAMDAAGKKVEAHFYDAGHAFFNNDRPAAFHKLSADLAWERTIAFLNAALAS